MATVYDWVTLTIFAGLIVLFLQRSMSESEPTDSIFQYLGASVGCAAANFLGNQGIETGQLWMQALAVAAIVATLAYVFYFLRPFDRNPRQ